MPMTAPHWCDPSALLLPAAHERQVACAPALAHAAFAERCLGVAAGLRASGARQAALWFDDAAELAVALYACWRADVVAVLPNDVLAGSCARLDRKVDVWLSDTALTLPAGRVRRNDDMLGQPPLPAARLDEGSGGVTLHTSGSSGAPKRIVKQWGQLAQEVRALGLRWPAATPACVLGSVNPHHMFGLVFRVLWPLCAGHSIDRRQRLYPEELEAASLEHPHCVWVTSPALLRRIGERVDWPGLRPRLRSIYSAGGPLPARASEAIARAGGCRPIEIYGSSETGAVATRQDEGPWQALAGVRLEVDADDVLWVGSPWTEHAREQTADAAVLEAGGMRLLERRDRIVKLEEKRISLPGVEDALAAHPYVAEARVGMASGKPRLCALIALSAQGLHALRNSGRRHLVDALRLHLGPRVEPLAIPRTWRLLGELPWNAQGKLTAQQFDELAGARPRAPVFEAAAGGDGTSWQAGFHVPPDLLHFSGHFPDTPIVPGVLQISWAVQAAREHLVPGLRVSGIENLKFQRLMRPMDRVTLTLRWDAARAKLSFAYHHADAQCSCGRIVHAP